MKHDEHLLLFLDSHDDDAAFVSISFLPRSVIKIGWFFATTKHFDDESEKKRDDDDDDDEEKRVFLCDE